MKQLVKPWHFMARAVMLFFEEFYLMVGLSIMASLAMLTVVAAPAAAAGLITVASRMVAGRRVSMDFFWQGAKEHLAMTYKVMVFWGVMLGLFVFNIYFYMARISGSLRYVAGFWGYVAMLWLVLGFYLLPVLQRMKKPSVKAVFLNAFVLAFRQPLYSFVLLLQFGILSLLWRYLPPVAVLLWPSLLALMVVSATEFGLAAMREKDDQGKKEES